MSAPFKIDTSKLTAMCHEQAKLTGASFENTVEYEVGRVLEKAIAFTPAAHIDKIRAAQESAHYTAQPDTLYSPQTAAGRAARAKAHRTGKKNLLLYWLENRYPDALWSAILEARKQSLIRKIAARGFSKWTWASIAAKLGIGIRIPGYVSTAGGHVRSEVTAVRKHVDGAQVGIWIENSANVLQSPFVKGASALQRAINGRVRYFYTNLRKKVFSDMAKIAKRYPGVTVAKP